MSTPKYFSYFPNIQYAQNIDRNGKIDYLEIKDYFHLLTVRDDIYREDTLYEKYTVRNGERPDQVSYRFYGDEQFYWILLQLNDITDYYNQWPLSQFELEEFIDKKYGASGTGDVHHYETVETFDKATPPNLLLQGGLTVASSFKFTYPTTPGSSVYLTSLPRAIDNYRYETRLNDVKSQIFILQKKYVYQYLNEVRSYGRNLDASISYKSNSDFDVKSNQLNRDRVFTDIIRNQSAY